MNVFQVPLESEAKRFSFAVDLDGREFKISLDWSSRTEDWYLSLADSTGALLVSGQRVILGIPMIGPLLDARLPAGELIFLCSLGSDVPPGHGDLGKRVQLFFVTP